MSRDLPLIIVNPKSGRGMTEQSWASRASVIRDQFGPFECRFTEKQAHAIQLAEDEARAGRKLIIAVGGDGTVSETANGILRAGTDAALGMLPGGTGGDFRRTLGVSADLAKACRQLRDGKIRRMDTGKLTYIDHSGNQTWRYFVNTASFGMSGAVASRANQSSKRLGGTLTYATATVRTAVSFDSPEIYLQLDEGHADRLRVIMVCVANGPSFGGGMRIAPNAKLDDGVFDVIVAGDITAFRLLISSHRLYAGTHLSMDKIALKKARKVHAVPVHENNEILLEVDGESPGRLPATMEIIPQALNVRC